MRTRASKSGTPVKVVILLLLSSITVTYDGPTRYYGYLITSSIGVLTYFGARGTAPTSTHCTASTMVGRGPIGCHISFPETKTCPGSRYLLAHGWVGVLTCKGVRQNSASSRRTSLVSNLGAGCESSTWDPGSLHTVLVRNQLKAWW